MRLLKLYEKHLGNKPERVYKFFTINENLEKSIKGNYLWLSKPSGFNDPFDCNPNLISFKPDKKTIKQLFKSHPPEGNRKARREEIYRNINRPEEIKEGYASAREEMNNHWGICCLTRNFQNNLMWSHYANNHSGLCLAFAPKESLMTLVDVKYTNDFKPLDYGDGKEEAIFNMFITKSLDWNYEEEMRICKRKSGPLKFEKSLLKEVIFGCKTTDENKQKIIGLLNENKYTNIAFKQASMRKDSFSLEFKEL